MDDDEIYQKGGTDRDVKEYAKNNGADLVKSDFDKEHIMTDKQWENTIGDELGEFKVPCSCPKGGQDDDGTVCDKCDGSEWVLPPKLIEVISQELKKQRDAISKVVENHYWDSLEKDRDLIITHFNACIKEIRKYFPKE